MRTKSPEREKKILDSAHELFLKNGYSLVSVDEIAAHAGTTKRTIYGYFPSKRELFRGVIERAVGDPWSPNQRPDDIKTQEDLRRELMKVAEKLNGTLFKTSYVQLLRVVITEIPNQADLDILAKRGITKRAIEVLLVVLIAANESRLISTDDTELAAQSFVGLFITRTLLFGLLKNDGRPPKKLDTHQISRYVTAFLDGITKKPRKT